MPSKKTLPVKQPYEAEQRAYNELLQRMQPTKPLFQQADRARLGDWTARTEWGMFRPSYTGDGRVAVYAIAYPERRLTSDEVLEDTTAIIRDRRKMLLTQGLTQPDYNAPAASASIKPGVSLSLAKCHCVEATTGANAGSAMNIRRRVGGDPEFFLQDVKGNVVPSSVALGLDPTSTVSLGYDPVGKTIGAAFPDPLNPGMMAIVAPDQPPIHTPSWVHQDGVQAELGYTPQACLELTSLSIRDAFQVLKRQAAIRKCSMTYKTSVEISEEMAAMFPLGCRPSFNAWGNDNCIVNPYPTKRFGGGHFHFGVFEGPGLNTSFDATGPFNLAEYKQLVNESGLRGWSDKDIENHINPVVRRLDAVVGLVSVALCRGMDDPERRRHRYGMAGDYRLTANTLEYRVPSNAVWFHPVTWHICAMLGRGVIATPWAKRSQIGALAGVIDRFIQDNEQAIVQAIDQTDPDLAVELLGKPHMPKADSFIKTVLNYGDQSLRDNYISVMNLVMKGAAFYLQKAFPMAWEFDNYTSTNATLSRQKLVPVSPAK